MITHFWTDNPENCLLCEREYGKQETSSMLTEEVNCEECLEALAEHEQVEIRCKLDMIKRLTDEVWEAQQRREEYLEKIDTGKTMRPGAKLVSPDEEFSDFGLPQLIGGN